MSSPLVLIKFIMKKILTGFSLGLLLFVGAGQAMAQTAEVTATSKLPFSTTLGMGSKGNSVRALQKVLIAKGYLSIGAPTGTYGTATKKAVAAYQKANKVSSVGVVGPKTLQLLNAEKNVTSLIASDAIVLSIWAGDSKIYVTGRKLASVKVWGYSTGTGIEEASIIGNATLTSTGTSGDGNGVQTWTLDIASGSLFTEIYALGYANDTLVGKVTLSNKGASSIYEALWGTSKATVTGGTTKKVVSSTTCAGVTGMMVRFSTPVEDAWLHRGAPMNISWKSCNMSSTELLWFQLVQGSGPDSSTGTTILLTPGAGEINSGSATYTVPTEFHAGIATLHVGKLVESPVGSGERVFNSMAAIPNLHIY